LIQWAVREQNLSPHINYYLAATDAQTGDVMAEAAMKTIPPDQGQGETGFGIMPTNWNKGYATESPAAC
jgi:RimJ/RimL family protein N-acetyltransferase